jgi:glycosyltransferase involved in cell wall biosynthesis
MSEPGLSVIICTHNPRADYLRRTLGGLSTQSIAADAWELLIVANATRDPLASRVDLAWHPAPRIIAEPELGLTAARLRGIAAARTEILVFVDDDNVLAPDYLARSMAISRAWPMLGAWGCGNYVPEWESPPPPEFAPYLDYLAVHQVPRDRWSNQYFDYPATPAGAGMCVRTPVAIRYAESVRHDQRRKRLDRSGTGLAGCGDFDLALTAIDAGLGVGVLTELTMTHLMPAGRVEELYLLRLVEGHAYSTVLLHSLRNPNFTAPRQGVLARLHEFRLRCSLSLIARKIHDARRRGEQRAWRELGKGTA